MGTAHLEIRSASTTRLSPSQAVGHDIQRGLGPLASPQPNCALDERAFGKHGGDASGVRAIRRRHSRGFVRLRAARGNQRLQGGAWLSRGASGGRVPDMEMDQTRRQGRRTGCRTRSPGGLDVQLIHHRLEPVVGLRNRDPLCADARGRGDECQLRRGRTEVARCVPL